MQTRLRRERRLKKDQMIQIFESDGEVACYLCFSD